MPLILSLNDLQKDLSIIKKKLSIDTKLLIKKYFVQAANILRWLYYWYNEDSNCWGFLWNIIRLLFSFGILKMQFIWAEWDYMRNRHNPNLKNCDKMSVSGCLRTVLALRNYLNLIVQTLAEQCDHPPLERSMSMKGNKKRHNRFPLLLFF